MSAVRQLREGASKQPITRHNAPQARAARDDASQYLTGKGIEHRINVGTTVTAKQQPLFPGLPEKKVVVPGNAAVIPTTSGPHRAFSASANPAIPMHEAGHIANADLLARMIGRPAANVFYRAREPVSNAANLTALTLSALAPEDSVIGQNSHAIALLGSMPLLGEEAAASARAFNQMRRKKLQYALKHLPILMRSWASHTSVPTLGIGGSYIVNRWNRKNEQPDQ